MIAYIQIPDISESLRVTIEICIALISNIYELDNNQYVDVVWPISSFNGHYQVS